MNVSTSFWLSFQLPEKTLLISVIFVEQNYILNAKYLIVKAYRRTLSFVEAYLFLYLRVARLDNIFAITE